SSGQKTSGGGSATTTPGLPISTRHISSVSSRTSEDVMLRAIESLPAVRDDEIGRIRDIYVPLSLDSGGRRYALNLQSAVAYTDSPMAKRLFVPGSETLMAELLAIAAQVDSRVAAGMSRFRLETERFAFRAQTGRNAGGADLQLRVLPSEVPQLSELRMSNAWLSLLMADTLFSGGLILIAAPHGQGKTTTASSMVASRLTAY